ncbi:hypothetical protein LTS07_001421 [Exophiala sideris]|uniref:TRP C-terminal domain-containing protein n=1 Tax=Exophiala sideris TaxID=1016849 RepID=A0ABR0JN82_9EURO|nr:hypothetical protein LTS07_001421 [Exophiala sideris]KAK5067436.1 hypothetical protein LTR69_001423 [Exophiala sideris]
MGLFVVMLLVAMIPTGNYEWFPGYYGMPIPEELDGPGPRPSDYAICHFGEEKDTDKLAYTSMVISILLVVFGFLSRVVRLHKTISVQLVAEARKYVSARVRNWLQKVYDWCDIETSPAGLKRLLIYRPLLALFLCGRALSDAWSSMFFEVSYAALCLLGAGTELKAVLMPSVQVFWLFISFLWGALKFFGTFLLAPQGNSAWTFGQIVPVVLLAAPLLAIAEYLYPGSTGLTHQQSAHTEPSDAGSGTSSKHAVRTSQTDALELHEVQTTTVPMTLIPATGQPSASASPPTLDNATLGDPTSRSLSPGRLDGNHAQAERRSSNLSSPIGSPTASLPRISTLQLANSIHSLPPDRVRDDPGYDFYTETLWYKCFVGLVILEISCVTLYFVTTYGTIRITSLVSIFIPTIFFWDWLPILVLISLMLFVLNALMIETFRRSPSRWLSPRSKAKMATILLMFNGVIVLLCQVPSLSGTLTGGYSLEAGIAYWSHAKIIAMLSRG